MSKEFRLHYSLGLGGDDDVGVGLNSGHSLTDDQYAAKLARQRIHKAEQQRTNPEYRSKRAAERLKYAKVPLGTKDENPHDPRLPPEHGTASMYQRHACRCDRCKMCNRDLMRMYRTGELGPEENMR